MTHFLRYKNKGVIEKSLTSLISLTPPFSFYAFSSAQTQIYLCSYNTIYYIHFFFLYLFNLFLFLLKSWTNFFYWNMVITVILSKHSMKNE